MIAGSIAADCSVRAHEKVGEQSIMRPLLVIKLNRIHASGTNMYSNLLASLHGVERDPCNDQLIT
jgi:hypothetical protein